MNEKKFLNKQLDELTNGENKTDALQSIIAVHAGRIYFHLMKNAMNALVYGAPVALAFGGGDWDKFNRRMDRLTKGYFNLSSKDKAITTIKNSIVQSLLDNYVIGQFPAENLTAYALEKLEIKARKKFHMKGTKTSDSGNVTLQDWEHRAYQGGADGVGGFVSSSFQQFVEDAKRIYENTDKPIKKQLPDIGLAVTKLVTAIFGTNVIPIPGADMQKYLQEIKKNQKLNSQPSTFTFGGKSDPNFKNVTQGVK